MNRSFTCSYIYCKHEWCDGCLPNRTRFDETYVPSPEKNGKGKTFAGGMSWEQGVGNTKEAEDSKKVTGEEKNKAPGGAKD